MDNQELTLTLQIQSLKLQLNRYQAALAALTGDTFQNDTQEKETPPREKGSAMANTYRQHANALKEINDRKEILAQHYRMEVSHAVKMYLRNLLTLDELSQHMGTLEKEQAAALDQLNQEINDLPDYTLSPISPMHRDQN